MDAIDKAWPNPEDAAKVRAMEAASEKISRRIHMEAARDGDISGKRMVEIFREERPELSERDANQLVMSLVQEIVREENKSR